MTSRGPFIVIGENLHATRVLLREGRHVATADDGRLGVAFTDADGTSRVMPLATATLESGEFSAGKIKHIRNAVLLGLGDGAVGVERAGGDSGDAKLAEAYLTSLARRQAAAAASYIDLNVDEVSERLEIRVAAMEWLVRLLEPEIDVPLSLDSSSREVLAAGLAATTRPHGAPLLNSASLERLDILDLASEQHCPVVLSAVGRGGVPTGAANRVANAEAIIAAAVDRGLPRSDAYVDPLVLPVAVDPAAGAAYLEAVRSIRGRFGSEIHLTGGLSNVSFGLPLRRLLNDVFVALAIDAGADSGIIDPIATNLERVRALDRTAESFWLAEDVLTGRDEYGGEYLAAFRAGRLETA